MGHSWGSVLGLEFVEQHPELVRAYVGCGQVVNMKKSCRAAYDFALAHADPKATERLRGIDCAYTGENWLDDLLFVTKQVVKQKGSLYGRRNYNDLVKPFLWSKYYSIAMCPRRLRGLIMIPLHRKNSFIGLNSPAISPSGASAQSFIR